VPEERRKLIRMSESKLSLKWTIVLPEPRADVNVQPEQLVEAACAVEAAGFHAVWVSDHPLPYDLSMLASSGVSEGPLRYDMRNAGHQAWDPFTVLGWLAAGHRSTQAALNAVVMPYRNPFVTAKAAATLQHLSGGRLIMGLAPGYLRAEFEALGADISARAELVQEGLHAMRAASAGKPFQLRSSRSHVDGNSALPAPDPQPVVWAAGNSRATIELARSCDGWAPFEVEGLGAQTTGTVAVRADEKLTKRLELYHTLRQEAAHPGPSDVCLTRTDWTALTERPETRSAKNSPNSGRRD
jgi:alkanesulfonate monooxygenase SsuD/methylene tetrahydromethanopterin reductase-like flavin-dependent oxidoreductase (luciferase family)